MNTLTAFPVSEAVLAGHPDHWCDCLADHIVKAITFDINLEFEDINNSYAQIEVSAWQNDLFITGEVWDSPLGGNDIEEAVRETVASFTRASFPEQKFSASPRPDWNIICRIRSHFSEAPSAPSVANDQAVATGYAWAPPGSASLPPAHFLALRLAAELNHACQPGGDLDGLGPDGKLLVRLHPLEPDRPHRPASVVLTLQHPPSIGLLDVSVRAREFVTEHLAALASVSRFWDFDPAEFELEINPNGEFHQAGFFADGGQTGRKLVFDYYGPSVPIGGGALHGKSLTHVDRAAALATRYAATRIADEPGVHEVLITAAYKPGIATPVWFDMRIRTDKGWETSDINPPFDKPPEEFLAIFEGMMPHPWKRKPRFWTSPLRLEMLASEGHFFRTHMIWNQRKSREDLVEDIVDPNSKP